MAWTAFGLALLGVVGGFVPGVIGWVVAERELRNIEQGESPPGGRTFVQAARLMGMLCTGALVAVVLISLFWLTIR
ncbi:hypothetical protein HPC49_17185 [Pyxidicoccus fallax]|uniref:DUF4190 domain-containing protein n=1 Tax=Pyxidicoccus fallax TaxID=394095 RepID=A0A848LGS5_9BACT|nr:hypothetical protein [Pyxidicoccus fallax]NMO15971.1 hypothetical protein [Pyxidicoccus fallax]NPC79949.1 hypothetical protein [Pyxidicoccus fallax]